MNYADWMCGRKEARLELSSSPLDRLALSRSAGSGFSLRSLRRGLCNNYMQNGVLVDEMHIVYFVSYIPTAEIKSNSIGIF